MFKTIARAVAVTAVPLLALTMTAGASNAATSHARPDNLSTGVNITTNNGVAGYYAYGSLYRRAQFDVTTEPAAADMIVGTDGVGGQLCNNGSGDTAGAGLENTGNVVAGLETFKVLVGVGVLSGNPSSNDPSNQCLGGILPPNDISAVGQLAAVPLGDAVQFNIRQYSQWVETIGHGRHHHHWWTHRYGVKFLAQDVTTGLDVWAHSELLPKSWGDPDFNQFGVGSQRTTTLLTVASTANPLAEFSNIESNGSQLESSNTTGVVQVNSSGPNANNDGHAEPNPFAQVDPINSLSSNTFYVYVGSPVA
jgi:hypothetical protein